MTSAISYIKRKFLLALIWFALKRQRAIISSANTAHDDRFLALRRVMDLVERRAELWTERDVKRAERRRGLA